MRNNHLPIKLNFNIKNEIPESSQYHFKVIKKRSPSHDLIFDSKIKLGDIQKIPCYLCQHPTGSNMILLHFHGNAEDIGDSAKYMRKLALSLKVILLIFY